MSRAPADINMRSVCCDRLSTSIPLKVLCFPFVNARHCYDTFITPVRILSPLSIDPHHPPLLLHEVSLTGGPGPRGLSLGIGLAQEHDRRQASSRPKGELFCLWWKRPTGVSSDFLSPSMETVGNLKISKTMKGTSKTPDDAPEDLIEPRD